MIPEGVIFKHLWIDLCKWTLKTPLIQWHSVKYIVHHIINEFYMTYEPSALQQMHLFHPMLPFHVTKYTR